MYSTIKKYFIFTIKKCIDFEKIQNLSIFQKCLKHTKDTYILVVFNVLF